MHCCVGVCVPAAYRPCTVGPASFCDLICIMVLEHVSYAVANVVMTRLGHLRRLHQSALISCGVAAECVDLRQYFEQ